MMDKVGKDIIRSALVVQLHGVCFLLLPDDREMMRGHLWVRLGIQPRCGRDVL